MLFDKTAQDDLIDLLRLVQRLDKDVFLIVKPGGVILLLTFLAEKKKGAFLIAVKAGILHRFLNELGLSGFQKTGEKINGNLNFSHYFQYPFFFGKNRECLPGFPGRQKVPYLIRAIIRAVRR